MIVGCLCKTTVSAVLSEMTSILKIDEKPNYLNFKK